MKNIIRFSASVAPKLNCLLRLKRTIIDGYQESLPYNDMQYGSAVHKFISTMHETKGDFSAATLGAKRIFSKPCEIRKGKKHLTEIHLLKTCFDYWEHYQKTDDFDILIDKDGKPLVECSFSNTIWSDEHNEIRFEGVIDKVGKFKNGCYGVGDYKITSAWSQQDYFEQYLLSTQLRFYLYNLKLSAKNNPDSLLAKICEYPIGYFIDGIFISKDGAIFKRSDVIVPSDQEDKEFASLVSSKILPTLLRFVTWPEYNERDGIASGACCELKYPCEYLYVCSACDDIARKHVLNNSFIQKPYEPLTHSKD